MKGSDKAIFLGVLMALVLGVFYLKVLSPKRDEATALKGDISKVKEQVAVQKGLADAGEEARANYATYYGKLVVMGKAAPAAADTGSLLVSVQASADRSKVDFDALKLSDRSSTAEATAAAAPAPAPTGTPPASGSAPAPASGSTPPAGGTTPPAGGTATPAAATTAPAPATEAGAANLPIGAVVGSAGLPTMPYDLKFEGSFFDTTSFFTSLDSFVNVRDGGNFVANGRLLTVDGFSIKGVSPELEVNLAVTSYITPSNEGLTAGATPSGPAPTTVQPASATVAP
jgi:hypothetical protein